MPYIKQEDRNRVDGLVDKLSDQIKTVGELNYVVTRLALRLLGRMGVSYNNLSNVIGTLTLIPAEINRRLVWPYEDDKIEQNGDVEEFEERSI